MFMWCISVTIQVLTEENLLMSKQQFEGHLSEMCEKNDMLSSTLNEETERRRKTEGEVTSLKSRLDEAIAEVKGLKKEEKMLTQQLEEVRREVVIGQKDLDIARWVWGCVGERREYGGKTARERRRVRGLGGEGARELEREREREREREVERE